MGWNTPKTWTPGEALSASELNDNLRDDLNYLLSRPGDGVQYDNGANYTTTSDTFTPVDGTNLSITLTTAGGKIACGFSAVCPGLTSTVMDFDITVDGTRIGAAGANGLYRAATPGSNLDFQVSFTVVKTGLTPGSHTVQVVWKRHTSGTGTCALYAGNGTAGQDFIPSFWAMEVG
jgi:hypothetical protein